MIIIYTYIICLKKAKTLTVAENFDLMDDSNRDFSPRLYEKTPNSAFNWNG